MIPFLSVVLVGASVALVGASTALSSTCTPSTITSTSRPAAATSSYQAVRHWFTFGDSYTATGFNPSLGQPSDTNPIGNPEYPGNTICGPVPTWVDFMATKYNATLQLVYNFASIGATINGALVPVLPWVIPLVTQTEFFAGAYAGDGPSAWASDDTIFSIWIGINDIGNSYNESGSRTAFNDQLLEAYFEQTTRLYGFGARKFAFFNVPPFDRSPLLLSLPAVSQATASAIIHDYNAKLRQRVTEFARKTPTVDAWLIDVNSLITSLLDAPQGSGFVDATSFGALGNVIWCDDFHLAPAVHDLIAGSARSVLVIPAIGRNESTPPPAPCVPEAGDAYGRHTGLLCIGPGLSIAIFLAHVLIQNWVT